MKSFQDQLQIINTFHELGETIAATEFLMAEYQLSHPNLKGIALREPAKPDYILMTAEGEIGDVQIIRIPENTYEFPLALMLNLLAHEMMHVIQKAPENRVEDKCEREWQAYYEMIFHKQFPLIPIASDFHIRFFTTKAFEYYHRMGENSALQQKYAVQKAEIEMMLSKM